MYWSYNSCKLQLKQQMWQHCTLCYIIMIIYLKSSYTLNVCIQLAITGVVQHGIFIAVTIYVHLSSFKFGLCPLTQNRQKDPMAIVVIMVIIVYYVYNNLHFFEWAGVAQSVQLHAGRFGDRIPVGGEIFCTRPDRPWGPPSLLYNRYWVIPAGKTGGT